jgi:predicted RNA-binding Zn ribbon-like protein
MMATTVARASLADLRIVGGNLALDFVNTCAGPRGGAVDTEWLSSYADFTAWSHLAGLAGLAGLADPAGFAGLGVPPEQAASRPDAIAAFARVLACRDDMHEIFSALADGSVPPDPALRRLHVSYVEAIAAAELAVGPAGWAWRWDPGSGLLAPLWPVVAAAVELLTSGPAGLVKPCHGCRFLFIDQSKNGSRRWCSMEDCGKSAKIARYLQRRSDARGR